MLILGRRVGETICIGDKIEVTILCKKNAQVRIGINAPDNVPVHRQEVYQQIHGTTGSQSKEADVDAAWKQRELEARR